MDLALAPLWDGYAPSELTATQERSRPQATEFCSALYRSCRPMLLTQGYLDHLVPEVELVLGLTQYVLRNTANHRESQELTAVHVRTHYVWAVHAQLNAAVAVVTIRLWPCTLFLSPLAPTLTQAPLPPAGC